MIQSKDRSKRASLLIHFSRKHRKIITVTISHDSDTGLYSLRQAEHGKVEIGRAEDWEPADPVGLWDVTIGGDLVDCGAEAARMLSRVLFDADDGARLVYHKRRV